MPKIKGTEWYTACVLQYTKIEGSERCQIAKLNGYRRSVKGMSAEEIKKQIETLKSIGVFCEEGKPRTSPHNHTDMPRGTPFLQVSEPRSVANLEKSLVNMGIELPANRFDVYTQPSPLAKKRGGR